MVWSSWLYKEGSCKARRAWYCQGATRILILQAIGAIGGFDEETVVWTDDEEEEEEEEEDEEGVEEEE